MNWYAKIERVFFPCQKKIDCVMTDYKKAVGEFENVRQTVKKSRLQHTLPILRDKKRWSQ